MVTRAQEAASALTRRLEALGAAVLEVPLLRFDPPESYAPLDAALRDGQRYDMLLVTSANTARVVADRITRLFPGAAEKGLAWPDQPWTAAIGKATAEAMRALGLRVDLVPGAAVGEALLAAVLPRAAGKRILLPRALVARDLLPDGLRQAGATVDVIPAYRTVPAWDARDTLQAYFSEAEPVESVVFTSGSTVDTFFLLLGESFARAALARSYACSIGPVTTERLRHYGVARVATAVEHDLDGVVQVVLDRENRR